MAKKFDLQDFLGYRDISDKLDEMDRKLNVIIAGLKNDENLSPDLERAIKQVSRLATSIDQQVSDKPTKTKKK